MTLISLIIPVYKVEKHIEKCIRSVLAQSYRQFEVVLVDDCTPDRSVTLAEALLASQTEIPYRIIRMQQNSGISAVRNIGLAEAMGDFILFIDSDDWMEPTMLARLAETAVNDGADMVFCRARNVYELSERRETLPSLPAGRWERDQVLLALFKGIVPTHLCKLLISKHLYQGVQFPVGVIYEDVLTLPYIVDKARTIYFIDDILYNYMQREGSITKSYNPELARIITTFESMSAFFTSKLTTSKLRLAYQRYIYLTYHVIACHAVYFSVNYEQAEMTLRACAKSAHYRAILRLLICQPSRTIADLLLLKTFPRQFYRSHKPR